MAAAKCRNRRRELTDTLQAVGLNQLLLLLKLYKSCSLGLWAQGP